MKESRHFYQCSDCFASLKFKYLGAGSHPGGDAYGLADFNVSRKFCGTGL